MCPNKYKEIWNKITYLVEKKMMMKMHCGLLRSVSINTKNYGIKLNILLNRKMMMIII